MSNLQYIERLSSILFWDIDKEHLDADKSARQIIQRVLEYGTLADWRLTRNHYGMNRIVEECKQLRTLDPMALSFICAMSDTKKEEYRCYHFAQSYIANHKSTWRKTGDMVFDNAFLIKDAE